MCVKLPPKDLNPGPYPPLSISTYTYGVTIAPRVCGSHFFISKQIVYLSLVLNFFLKLNSNFTLLKEKITILSS